MNRDYRLAAGLLIFFVALVLSACSPEQPALENSTETGGPISDSAAGGEMPPAGSAIQESTAVNGVGAVGERIAMGELREVDMNAMTFVLKEADETERTFVISAATEVVGADGAQGLSGLQGNRAQVRYIEQGGSALAVHIAIEAN